MVSVSSFLNLEPGSWSLLVQYIGPLLNRASRQVQLEVLQSYFSANLNRFERNEFLIAALLPIE